MQITGSQLQDAWRYFFFFRLKIATTFWRNKNNSIKVETYKTSTLVADSTRKWRFRYIKIWKFIL